MVTFRKLRGIDLPRRSGTARLAGLDPETRQELRDELAALDQNLREVLSRIKDDIEIQVTARTQAGTDIQGAALEAVEFFDFEVSGENVRLEVAAVYDAGSKSAAFTLDAANGYDQTVTLTANCSLTGISSLSGPGPFSLRVSAGSNTLTLQGSAFEGPKLTFTGTAGISFKDFGTGTIVAMGGEW